MAELHPLAKRRFEDFMNHASVQSETAKRSARTYFVAFLFACFLFWWLPSILYRLAGIDDPVKNFTLWISILGAIAFATGFYLHPMRFRTEIPEWVMDGCERLAWKATLWIAIPALVVAVRFFWYRSGVVYGQGEGLSIIDQAVLYTHLFFAFLFLGATKAVAGGSRRIVTASLVVILPRLIISLHWGRFFLAQAVVPVLFIAVARGWLRMTMKRWFQVAALALVVVFIPALTRGEQFLGQQALLDFFAAGNTLQLLQNNADLDLSQRCPPLFVSMTDKVIPYGLLGICTVDIWGRKDLPATLDRILADNDPSVEGTLEGPGANYLLELYLSGGITVVIIGSIFFGYTNRCFVDWVGRRSLFAGIWAECLSRSLFAPRSTLGYVYERIPSLVLATGLIILITVATRSHSHPLAVRGSEEGGVA
jgi:hypothetical protein